MTGAPDAAAAFDVSGGMAEAERVAVREAVTEAVLGTPAGLREALAHDPAASLRLVEASRAAAEQASQLLTDAVANARNAGHSWDVIGRLIGVSRQAAQQRFGAEMPARPESTVDTPGAAARRVLMPLTAFNEMAVLEEEGRRGWHVVDYGTLYHVVEASESQWEHRRAVWAPGVVRRRAGEGWARVKTMTFPWGYYTRRLDVPAEPPL